MGFMPIHRKAVQNMKVTINPNKTLGAIKPMNAVNNGPLYSWKADQDQTNLPEYKAARIPYARTHDASIFYSYGGEHTVDVANIFPNFDADPDAPESYDFALTDFYLKGIVEAGTETFFRLGNKIEHWVKKYGIYPPKDFHKWAVICEHIIAHYTEGWADGFTWKITYWEIWNEPDGYGFCWMGTPEEFHELFAITAKHLKARFPQLKIGGPAVCGYRQPWLDDFFTRMREENVPIDFYSWHRYTTSVQSVVDNIRLHRELLDKFGYTKTESILNEWNYVRKFNGSEWLYSLDQEKKIKGAAFMAAVMTASQDEPVDMLMYYDARMNSGMNGIFSTVDYKTLKGYHVVYAWSDLAELGTEVEAESDIPDIYAVAVAKDGNVMTMLTYYTDNDNAVPKTFKVYGLSDGMWGIYLLDDTHDMVLSEEAAVDDSEFFITMRPNSVIVIKKCS